LEQANIFDGFIDLKPVANLSMQVPEIFIYIYKKKKTHAFESRVNIELH
jgi:hypothetical protein